VVRQTLAALERAFEAHFREPRSIMRAYEEGELPPEWQEWLAHLDPETEWRTIFLGETFRGHAECVRVWSDYLRWAEDYRATLEHIEDLGGDRVYTEVSIVGQSKDSRPLMATRLYGLFTIRDGLITRLEEYTTRDEALEAAGGILGS